MEMEGLDFTQNNLRLVATAAFVNSDTGVTYGKTECVRWSKPTLDLLKELRTSMELDIAAMVFVQGSAPTGGPLAAVMSGIGEHAAGPTEVGSV